MNPSAFDEWVVLNLMFGAVRRTSVLWKSLRVFEFESRQLERIRAEHSGEIQGATASPPRIGGPLHAKLSSIWGLIVTLTSSGQGCTLECLHAAGAFGRQEWSSKVIKEIVALLGNLPLPGEDIMVVLISGYGAYISSFIGLRSSHTIRDELFCMVVLGLVGYSISELLGEISFIVRLIAAYLVATLAGVILRIWLLRWWQKTMYAFNIHHDDGISNAWTRIIRDRGRILQISVHVKDGRILHLNDRLQYMNAHWQGLYLGSDGSIIFPVDEEELPDGTVEQRNDVNDDEWGVRLTYIPASEVCRVNMRMT